MVARRRILLVGLFVFVAFAFARAAAQDGTSLAIAATPEPPRLVTAPAEEVSYTSAKLVGSINPHGSPTTYYFAWGTSYYSLPNRTPELSAGEGTHSTLFYEPLSGLESGREYFYQLVATNGGGTSKGSIGHFVTLADKTAPTFGSPFGAWVEMREETPWAVFTGASDAGSGVAEYRHRVAVNGGPFGSWVSTEEPEFSGAELPGGSEVEIQAYAVDLAGNQSETETASIRVPNSPSELPEGATGPKLDYFIGSEEEESLGVPALAFPAAEGENAGIPPRVKREIAEHLLKADCTVDQVPPHRAYSHEIWHEVDNIYFACGPQAGIVEAGLYQALFKDRDGYRERRDHEDWNFGSLGDEIHGPFTVAAPCRAVNKKWLWFGGAGISVKFVLSGYGEFIFETGGETPLFADYCS